MNVLVCSIVKAHFVRGLVFYIFFKTVLNSSHRRFRALESRLYHTTGFQLPCCVLLVSLFLPQLKLFPHKFIICQQSTASPLHLLDNTSSAACTFYYRYDIQFLISLAPSLSNFWILTFNAEAYYKTAS